MARKTRRSPVVVLRGNQVAVVADGDSERLPTIEECESCLVTIQDIWSGIVDDSTGAGPMWSFIKVIDLPERIGDELYDDFVTPLLVG